MLLPFQYIIYVCMYVCMYVCIYIYIYVTYIPRENCCGSYAAPFPVYHICMYVCMYVCMYIYICNIHTSRELLRVICCSLSSILYMYVCMYVCMYIYLYVTYIPRESCCGPYAAPFPKCTTPPAPVKRCGVGSWRTPCHTPHQSVKRDLIHRQKRPTIIAVGSWRTPCHTPH